MAIIKTGRFTITEEAAIEDWRKRYPEARASAVYATRLQEIKRERELLDAAPPIPPLSGYVVEFREKPIAYTTSQADALKAMREFVGWWRSVKDATAPTDSSRRSQLAQTWDLRRDYSRRYVGTLRAKPLD